MVNQSTPQSGLDLTAFSMAEGNLWGNYLFPIRKLDTSDAKSDHPQLQIAGKLAVHLALVQTHTDKLFIVKPAKGQEHNFLTGQMPATSTANRARFTLKFPTKHKSADSYLAAIKGYAVQYSVEEVWAKPQSFIGLIEGKSKVADSVIACLAPEIYLSSRHYPEMFAKGFICLGYCHLDVPPNTPITPAVVRFDIPAKWFINSNYIGDINPSIKNGPAFPYFVPISSVTKHLKDPGVKILVSYSKEFRSQQKSAAEAEEDQKSLPTQTPVTEVAPNSISFPALAPDEKHSWETVLKMESARRSGQVVTGFPLKVTEVDFANCDEATTLEVIRAVRAAYQRIHMANKRAKVTNPIESNVED